MKIVISSTGNSLDSTIDPRFGRCSAFIIAETDDMSFESIDNESIALGGGAGIQSASFVVSKDVQAVLTGNCGPKAMQVFNTANVKVYTGFAGTIKDAIEKFKQGKLQATTEATVAEKAGVNIDQPSGNVLPQDSVQNMGGGQGMGGGRGMGGGGRCGGGQGRGTGQGRGMGGGGRGMGQK